MVESTAGWDVGSAEGSAVGSTVGALLAGDGDAVGTLVIPGEGFSVEIRDGGNVCGVVGSAVGANDTVGSAEGDPVTGCADGCTEGDVVVGCIVGITVGCGDGPVGC